MRWQCTIILIAWTSYQNYQILLAPCLRMYHRPPLFWLMGEWRTCWRVCLRKKKGYIKLSPDVDGRFINIGLFFTWQLLKNSLPAANPQKFCSTKKSRHLVCRQLLQHVNKCFTFSTVHKISPRLWASIKVTHSSSSCLFTALLSAYISKRWTQFLRKCLWTPLQHVYVVSVSWLEQSGKN